MSQLFVNNSLFWNYKGTILSSWYLCGDGSTADMRRAHLDWCSKYGCDTVVLCMNNEDIMSLFRDGYMRNFDDARVNIFAEYIFQIHRLGGQVILAFWDGPAIPNGKYHPILECMDRHEQFIKIVVEACNEYVAGYLIGCETNRYFSTEIVEAAIAVTKQYCGNKPVGTHEQWNPDARRWASNADFICYETKNHPAMGLVGSELSFKEIALQNQLALAAGNTPPLTVESQALVSGRSPADYVSEVKHVQSHLPPGYPFWFCEYKLDCWTDAGREIARTVAALPGVYGIGGPL